MNCQKIERKGEEPQTIKFCCCLKKPIEWTLPLQHPPHDISFENLPSQWQYKSIINNNHKNNSKMKWREIRSETNYRLASRMQKLCHPSLSLHNSKKVLNYSYNTVDLNRNNQWPNFKKQKKETQKEIIKTAPKRNKIQRCNLKKIGGRNLAISIERPIYRTCENNTLNPPSPNSMTMRTPASYLSVSLLSDKNWKIFYY